MQIIPAKTPRFVKSIFPNFVWSIETEKKEIYLTFDDGPTPEITEWVLQTLKGYDAKATFFCIGNNIEKHPELFLKVITEGHSIGNHTFNHLKGWKNKTKNYIENTQKTQYAIDALFSENGFQNVLGVKLFRPPYGKFKSKQSKQLLQLGYKIIMWDVISYDWDASVSQETCYNGVISSAKKGSIIVFHDSLKAERNLKYALPKVLDYYTEKGFEFKNLVF